jgi:ABC-type antimicrobial peptide transport system permease subunit
MMGLMLGCAGMGIIVMRGIEERRAELALMMVQGFGINAIKRLLFSEHALIAVTGTLAGLLPAVILSWSSVDTSSLTRIAYLLAIVLSCGAGSILLGLRSLRSGDLLTIIRNEV